MIIGHGGNIQKTAKRLGCSPEDIIDMSNNINPLGPMPDLTEFLRDNISRINVLPEADAGEAVTAFAYRHGISPDNALAGNGTTHFIYLIPQALNTRKALILGPTYADYEDACKMYGVDYTHVITEESAAFKPDMEEIETNLAGVDTVFICNPNNPTGTFTDAGALIALCESHPEVNFIIDESYLPFVDQGESNSLIGCQLPNVLVLNSMSKIFCIPGLRIGFLIARETIIKKFLHYHLPWCVNSLAQSAVCYLMTHRNEVDTFIEKSRRFIATERRRFTEMVKEGTEFEIIPSTTTFFLIRLAENFSAKATCAFFLEHRMLIRNCENFTGLSNRHVRIALKTEDVNTKAAGLFLNLEKRI